LNRGRFERIPERNRTASVKIFGDAFEVIEALQAGFIDRPDFTGDTVVIVRRWHHSGIIPKGIQRKPLRRARRADQFLKGEVSVIRTVAFQRAVDKEQWHGPIGV
jgi:hypothetical protein